jgi:DegV family protein with EDD domain
MVKIKIITDSSCDLPKDIIEKYEIIVLPLLINIGEKSYMDGVDINLLELLEKMEGNDQFPTTSQVNPQRFAKCYKKFLNEGYSIISIHLSSNMSGTYQSACIAKGMLEADNIEIVDSQNVTSGLGLLVLKACSLREQGYDIKAICEGITELIPHVKSVLAFDSLDNLVKGGRLSKTAGVIGNILGIKPILAVGDGEMFVMDKVRGSKKAVRYIIDYVKKLGIKSNEPSVLLHVENKDVLATLRDDLVKRKANFIECEVGCGVGVHVGPGACGIFFIEDF